jgi:hypothetical protein
LKKAVLLLLLLTASVFTTKAQIGYGYSQYSLGFGFSYMKPTTDVPYSNYGPAVNITGSYNLTPYTSFTLEAETGVISGGYSSYYTDIAKKLSATDKNYGTELAAIPIAYGLLDPYYRSYTNHYQMYSIHGDVQLGEFIDYDSGSLLMRTIRNIYLGTGIGMLYNNMSNVNRYNTDSTYYYGGSDHTNNVFIQVRAGYQLKYYNAYDEPFILLEVGYQVNYIFGYGLDGYSDPLFTFRNFEKTSGWHIGIKFNFGDVISYRKPIH